MTDYIRKAVLLFGIAVSFPLQAGEEAVDGAFGLKFGQTLDVSSMEQLATEKNGGIEYRFMPDNPYRPLSDYSVFVTPGTLRVYKIAGTGHFKSMQSCRSELSRLEKVLENKYVKTSRGISERFGDIPTITFGKGDGKIKAVCEGVFNSRELVLVYLDEGLQEQVAQEKAASTSDQQKGLTDTSGL